MAEKGISKLILFYPAAVIRHADIAYASVLPLNRDILRTGVYGIFHKLLYNGGRAFHHFSGGDLVYGLLGKEPYLSHFFHGFLYLSSFLSSKSVFMASIGVISSGFISLSIPIERFSFSVMM